MANDNEPLTRRRLLQTASVAGIAGFAGCSGGNSGGGSTATASGGSTAPAGEGKDFSDVTLSYWSQMWVNSDLAKQGLQKRFKDFENRTGATIKPRWSSNSAFTGGKWQQNMKSGDFPVLYDTSVESSGQFIQPGWVKPFDEYKDQFDKDTLEAINWIMDPLKTTYSGFKEDIYELPVGLEIGALFLARADHFKQAGLDIDDDFPPKNYQHLVQIGKQLQEKGPVKYGFQISGGPGDVTDEMTPAWSIADGGINGRFMNKDWSDSNYSKKYWKNTLKREVEIVNKHSLSNPGTVNMSDEKATRLLINGDVSMCCLNSQTFSIVLGQAPKLLKQGKIRTGPMWKGEAGVRGGFYAYSLGLIKRPKGVDKQKWQRKQEAAIELMKLFLQPKYMKTWPSIIGQLPTRSDVWPDLADTIKYNDQHKLIQSLTTMGDDIGPGWSAYPQNSGPVIYSVPAPLFQKALQGKISAKKACNKAHDTLQKQVFKNDDFPK